MYLQPKDKMLLFLLVHFFLSSFNIVSKDLRLSLSGVIFVRAAMNALKIPILKQILPASNNEIINHKDTEVCGDSTRGKHQEMAIAGIDLMLEISEENQNEKKYTDHERN